MDITRAAIEKNRITIVALFVVIAAGLSAYKHMSQAEDPGFVIRAAQVTTVFNGASPKRVEMLVTDKLEKAIQEIPELDYIESESKTGVSVITVNIKETYKNMRPIWDNLRRKVEKVEPDLPEGAAKPIVNDEFGDVFGTIIGLTGEGFSYAELKDIADDVRDVLLRLGDVAKVEIYGDQDERIFVEYNNARLSELGISPLQLRQILEGRNIIIPGGAVDIAEERIVLEPSGNFESVEDLAQTVIKLPNRSELVYLRDIATIERDYIDPPTCKVRISGLPGLAIAISMREGGNIVKLGDQITAVINDLQTEYPIGIEFNIVAFQPEVVRKKVSSFLGNLLQAILIVIVVMLLSLGVRTGLVVATLIPMAILAAFMVMGLTGIGLDQMSLAALIIALGLLVDNAIVMSESIMVQMQAGKEAVQAAVDSAKELRMSLLTSSLTTAAAFLPIYLAESTTGEYTAPIFSVVTITLLCSWVLALTMTPMLCVFFIKVKKGAAAKEESFDGGFYRRYRATLTIILKHRWISLAVVMAIFFIALQGFSLVPKVFFPASDRPIIQAELEFPLGVRIERTEEMFKDLEKYIQDHLLATGEKEGLTSWVVFLGQGAPRFTLAYTPESPSPNYAFVLINATTRDYVDQAMPKIEKFLFENYPDVLPTISPARLGPPIDSPVQIRLVGKDLERLFNLVDQTKAQAATIAGIRNISDDWGRRTKKLVVSVNQPRARRAGVTSEDIAVSLQTMLSGFQTTEYREDDKVIPVIMRSVAADRQDIGKVESLNVYSQLTGKSVPLKQVADTELVWEASKILRRNRLKTVTVNSDLTEGVTAAAAIGQLMPWLTENRAKWGSAYFFEIGGEVEKSGQANKSIGDKLGIALLLIILLLVGQFNSIRRPIIILITIPLGLIGVVIGLLLAKSILSFMALLGVVSLAGIVINNAIVLIDRIGIEIDVNGLPPDKAIIEAAQRRLRPILLTTATTVAGLMPLWLGGGPMWEPMAVTILFGLLFATVLTLGVVPLLYALFFRVKFQ